MRFRYLFALLVLGFAAASCSSSSSDQDLQATDLSGELTDLTNDTVVPDAGDVATDLESAADVADLVGDSLPPPDETTADLQDLLPDEAGDIDDTVPQDSQDLDVQPAKEFCYRLDACPAGQECNLSTGLCERRAKVLANVPSLYSLEPRQAAPGDRLVLDGEGFYKGILGSVSVKVVAGALNLSINAADENRVVAVMASGAGGTVKVTGDSGMALSPYPLTAGPSGIVTCSADDPPPWKGTATHPADPGPYGAGFVDFQAQGGGRVYYPAECGGVRRTPVAGSYPVVLLCHGDGAAPLNYEFMGKHLATWGIVSVMPDTSEPSEIAQLANDPAQAFDGPIPAPGLDTSAGVVLMGHSRGGDRIEQAWDSLNNVAGLIYLGQVNGGQVYGVPIAIFGASNDFQSDPGSYAEPLFEHWTDSAWKVIVQGGNHSGFTDHKVWQGFMTDGELVVERSRQHTIVEQYSLPFIQRVLGMDEPFASFLDSPLAEADFTVESK